MNISPSLAYCRANSAQKQFNNVNFSSKIITPKTKMGIEKEKIYSIANAVDELITPLAYGLNFQYMDDIQAENYVVKKIDALLANVDRYELKQVLSHKNKNNDPLFSLMFYGNSHKVEDFILNKIKTVKMGADDTLELINLKNAQGKNILQHNIEYYYGSNISINKILKLIRSFGVIELKISNLLTEKG